MKTTIPHQETNNSQKENQEKGATYWLRIWGMTAEMMKKQKKGDVEGTVTEKNEGAADI